MKFIKLIKLIFLLEILLVLLWLMLRGYVEEVSFMEYVQIGNIMYLCTYLVFKIADNLEDVL